MAVVALLYCIFKSACTKDGFTDYIWIWLFILCGLPFGIPRMFAWILPGGSLGTTLPLFLLNFIIGRVIGGFVLAWRLLVAAWYVPLTVYRLIVCYFSCVMAMRKTAARADAKAIHNLMEQTSLFRRQTAFPQPRNSGSLRILPQHLLRRLYTVSSTCLLD